MRIATPAEIAVYVHWPFCLAKCPYCDFNSHVRDGIDAARWGRALGAEIDHAAGLAPGRRVASIFFGGGTPSLMPPSVVAAVIARVARHWPLADAVEITLEANPTSVEAGRFADFRAAGVNRVSLGVQAFDDAALRFLGRGHDADQARAAIDLAATHFPRFSFDLIYARPGQTAAAWRRELAEAVDRAGDHLSLYQLTVEPGTRLERRVARGAVTPLGDDPAADLHDLTEDVLEGAGLPAYEISNYARPGGESRHNLAYWRAGDYLGVGPGAHGRLTRAGRIEARTRLRAPERWLAAVEARGHASDGVETVAAAERPAEVAMMGLRLVEGIDLARFEARAGRPFDAAVSAAGLADLIAAGLIERDPTRVRATRRGRRLLDAVLARLLV